MAHEYIRKPLTVTAIQWTGDNLNEVRDFVAPMEAARRGDVLALGSAAMWQAAYPDWWIIKNGETFQTMSDREFREIFERVGGGDDD